MGTYAVSVEKEISFRGFTERFSNIYHYAITAPVESDYSNLLEAVVARDKAAYPSAVTFRMARVWGDVQASEADNKMRFEKELTGGGTRTATATAIYPELCAVASIYVGRSPVKNRKVFVRKYIRYIRALDGTENSTDATLSSTSRDFFKNWMESLRTVTHNAVSFNMVTPLGRDVPDDQPAKCLQHMRIRQMKQ